MNLLEHMALNVLVEKAEEAVQYTIDAANAAEVVLGDAPTHPLTHACNAMAGVLEWARAIKQAQKAQGEGQ